MDDDELAYWGEYGRMVNLPVQMLLGGDTGTIIDLWNAFGALEKKVRDLTNP